MDALDSARAIECLPQILLTRARTQPDRAAYEFLGSDGTVESVTYLELATAAGRLAARLQEGTGPVLLMLLPGRGFVTAVWGCLLSGRPAVPAYPPGLGSSDRATARLRSVLADARPTDIVADAVSSELLTAAGLGQSLPVRILDQDAAAPGEQPARRARMPVPGGAAIVQYTSGSTGQPKGVMLTHDNLMANVRAITEILELDVTTRSVSWLPPYHDMGLIGCMLTPVYVGFPVRMMSPLDFLKSPLTWLRQISEIRATATGGPNFAYDLCVRRAGDRELPDIDLSSWQVALNGAEPVRPRTLRAFAQRFAGNGFRPSAFLPCYGLAEATLIVSGRHWDPAADAPGRDGQEPRVSCGPAVARSRLAIVSSTRQPVADGEEGEIWFSGPGVTPGYLGGQASTELFGDLDGRQFLRTGDIGYLRDGELFVTGRRTDVLVHRGVNYHAQDIEAAAVADNPEVRPIAAAFMVDDPEPRAVLVVERQSASAPQEEIGERLRARVLASTGLRLDTIVIGRPRCVPRTTSGKVQRRMCREHYLAGDLGPAVVVGPPAEPDAEVSLTADALGGFLAAVFAEVCQAGQCTVDQSLAEIGGDSLRAAEIAAVIEDAVALPVGVEDVLMAHTPRRLAAQVLDLWSQRGIDAGGALRRMADLAGEEAGR